MKKTEFHIPGVPLGRTWELRDHSIEWIKFLQQNNNSFERLKLLNGLTARELIAINNTLYFQILDNPGNNDWFYEKRTLEEVYKALDNSNFWGEIAIHRSHWKNMAPSISTRTLTGDMKWIFSTRCIQLLGIKPNSPSTEPQSP